MSGRITLGAIDAGSNAIRVVVAEMLSDGARVPGGPGVALTRIEAERVPVRLGRGAFTRGELDARTIDEAVAAFVHFRELFDRHGVEIYRAVATSAVRVAQNREVLLHRLYHEAGIELEIIEGEEEARLVRKAVVHAAGAGQPPRGILDLGGGSLEVNLRTGQSWRGYSLPIGTVRLLETFGLSGALGDAEAGMVRRYCATVIQNVLPPRTGDLVTASACGGNADALARILVTPEPAAASPGFELAALERALPDLLGLDVEARMARYGVRRDRAEVIAVAALVFATVGRQLGIQRLEAPGVGIREAVLLELAEAAAEERARAEGAVDKALLTAARTFANRVEHDTSHGERVRVLARSLFQQLRDVHQLPAELGVILELGALLHDVGEVVHTRGHHKHSEYMIRWGRIPGLEGVQREMVALLARCHRKSTSDVRKVIAEAALPKDRRGQLRRLIALLRLADGLDSGHRQRVESLVASRVGNGVVLDLTTRDGPGRDDAQLTRKADLFQEEFGVTLSITVGKALAPPVADRGAPPAPAPGAAAADDPSARAN
ncbi:MAG: HD domain-containing protein [Kofleriaceae bacterium]|nr:HD domain-containing protein [Kofleriaceae bacterium]